MLRFRLHAALPFVAAAAIACDRHPAATTPVRQVDAAIVAQLQRIGYRGPALVAERTVTDARGTHPMTRSLYLPARAFAALRRSDSAGAGATADMQRALAGLAALTAPDDADPAHNSPAADIQTMVSPSRLNGANPVQVQVNFNFSFLNYDPATDQWYTVPAGMVLESVIKARHFSSGHFHGSMDTMQLRLPVRVGRFVPATGSFTGSWATQWRVAEVSSEVASQFRVQESGGPNDGDVNWFFSFQNDAVRTQGLVQMPANTARYNLVGGTATHPEAFNDYATAGMVTAIQNATEAYYNATSRPATPTTPFVPGDISRVNDISLFYGGRFDVGRVVGGSLQACSDAATANCWQFSHFEHRLGTEVDIRNNDWNTPARRKKFYDALRGEFPSIKVEGDHYHARTSASVYR